MTTYGQLKTDARSWLARDDLSASVMDTAMRIAESDLAHRLRVRAQETAAQLVFTSGSVALPSDFLELVSVTSTDLNSPAVRVVPSQQMRRSTLRALDGPAVRVAIEGSNMLIAPVASVTTNTTLNITYFARFATLVGNDANSNWVTINAYQVFLYALLRALGEYLESVELEARYDAKLDRAIDRLTTAENNTRSSGGPLETLLAVAD